MSHTQPGSSLWWAWLLWWSSIDVAHYEEKLIERLAFAARYGGMTLTEALACDTGWLMRYLDAIAKFIEQENRRPNT